MNTYIHSINLPTIVQLDEGIMLIFVSEHIGHYFWRRVYVFILDLTNTWLQWIEPRHVQEKTRNI